MTEHTPDLSPAALTAPFIEGGIGSVMLRRGHDCLKDYVLSTEGDDHHPTEFERELLRDFLNGLMDDEAIFGPVRAVLAEVTRLREVNAGLVGAAKTLAKIANDVGFDFFDDDDPPEQVVAMEAAVLAVRAALRAAEEGA